MKNYLFSAACNSKTISGFC